MGGKDLFDDYMDFKLSGGSGGESQDTGGCFPWLLGAAIVLWLVSKLLF